jgi:fucose 4-O-acetylase-like acetyltransferase
LFVLISTSFHSSVWVVANTLFYSSVVNFALGKRLDIKLLNTFGLLLLLSILILLMRLVIDKLEMLVTKLLKSVSRLGMNSLVILLLQKMAIHMMRRLFIQRLEKIQIHI